MTTARQPDPPIASDALAHWESALRGLPPALELPTSRLRGADVAYTEAVLGTSLPAGAGGAPSEQRVRTAFVALLHRTTSQDDLVIGVADDGATQALRVTFAAETTFDQLAAQIDGALAAGRPHAAPLAAIAQSVGVDTASLLQVGFGAVEGPLDVALEVEPGAQGTTCRWRYNGELFDPATIERMGRAPSRCCSPAPTQRRTARSACCRCSPMPNASRSWSSGTTRGSSSRARSACTSCSRSAPRPNPTRSPPGSAATS